VILPIFSGIVQYSGVLSSIEIGLLSFSNFKMIVHV